MNQQKGSFLLCWKLFYLILSTIVFLCAWVVHKMVLWLCFLSFFHSFCLSSLPSPCFPVASLVWQYYYPMLLLICVCSEVYVCVCVESLKRLRTSAWTSPTTSSLYLFILLMITFYAHWSSTCTCNISRSSRGFRWSSVGFPPSWQAVASTQNGSWS